MCNYFIVGLKKCNKKKIGFENRMVWVNETTKSVFFYWKMKSKIKIKGKLGKLHFFASFG